MKNIMIDLETMGTEPNSAIIAIGAVQFDPVKKKLGEEFYRIIDLESAVQCGGVINPSTVLWWMQQSDEARSAFARKGETMPNALIDFMRFALDCAVKKDLIVWGNGADFDNVLLASALRNAGIEQPWMFYNNRCYRTLKNLKPTIKMKRSGTHHNALDDARDQTLHLFELI